MNMTQSATGAAGSIREWINSERAVQALVVDDESPVREFVCHCLARDGVVCTEAVDGHEALDKIANANYDLMIMDLKMPGMPGMDLLHQLKEDGRQITTIVLTGHGDVDEAVEATRLGAYDFILKPVEPKRLSMAVARALEHRRLVLHNRSLLRKIEHPPNFARLIGNSPTMLDVFRIAAQVAPTNANVLINGESGTGKEELARAIHSLSLRRDSGFNVVDCTAIPESLVESVLFGHKKGAFTGADRDHEGLLSYSDGGTVFFDEIGEIPLSLQAKLLRVIQERKFLPLGASDPIEVDIRILAATNRDLETEIQNGNFREDLFYRLSVVPVLMPPLRQRQGDIPQLAAHFFSEFSDMFPHIEGFTDAALKKMCDYHWPGNVRELRNVIERAMSLSGKVIIDVEDLPEQVRTAQNSSGNETTFDELPGVWNEHMQSALKHYLGCLLTHYKGNASQTARHAGLTRKTLYRMMNEVGIDPAKFRI